MNDARPDVRCCCSNSKSRWNWLVKLCQHTVCRGIMNFAISAVWYCRAHTHLPSHTQLLLQGQQQFELYSTCMHHRSKVVIVGWWFITGVLGLLLRVLLCGIVGVVSRGMSCRCQSASSVPTCMFSECVIWVGYEPCLIAMPCGGVRLAQTKTPLR